MPTKRTALRPVMPTYRTEAPGIGSTQLNNLRTSPANLALLLLPSFLNSLQLSHIVPDVLADLVNDRVHFSSR